MIDNSKFQDTIPHDGPATWPHSVTIHSGYGTTHSSYGTTSVGCRGGNRYVEGDLLLSAIQYWMMPLDSFIIAYLILHDTLPSLTIGYFIFDDSLA